MLDERFGESPNRSRGQAKSSAWFEPKESQMNKKALSESDICDRYISPAIEKSGWSKNQWRREYSFTDGRIIVRGKLVATR